MTITVGGARRRAAKTLRDVDNPAQEATWMLSALLGVDQSQLLSMERMVLHPDMERQLSDWLLARIAGKPLQYILGEWPFMGLSFAVREGVLIPREDSEVLAQSALEHLRQNVAPGQGSVLDLCTGSGAIAVSIGVYGQVAHLDGVDISKEACALAKDNAARNGVSMDVYDGDILSDTFWKKWGRKNKYDIITANPPYISSVEYVKLSATVRDHEPRIALEAGEDGLMFYRVLAAQAGSLLMPGGVIFMEIGHKQGEDVLDIFQETGWKCGAIRKDQNGKNRVVEAWGQLEI